MHVTPILLRVVGCGGFVECVDLVGENRFDLVSKRAKGYGTVRLGWLLSYKLKDN